MVVILEAEGLIDMTDLIEAGARFNALHAHWMALPESEERDDICDVLSQWAESIHRMPCTTLAELKVRARVVAWTHGLTHRAVPSEDEDYLAHVLATLIADVDRLTEPVL